MSQKCAKRTTPECPRCRRMAAQLAQALQLLERYRIQYQSLDHRIRRLEKVMK